MTPELFIAVIRQHVRDAAISDVCDNLKDPPGRRPSKNLVEMAEWYCSQDRTSQEMIDRIIAESVDEALFGMFCVLDGVRVISDGDSNSTFQLNYVSPEESIPLNDIHGPNLHDLFNSV
jgi:hypothetical protein